MKQIFTRFGMFAAACAFALNVAAEKAPVYIETDMTAQFSTLTDWHNWVGATGYVGWAAPTVKTNTGQEVACCERYNGTCDNTGDVFYQTVTGLPQGTYKIELYGGAAFTFGRGFTSEAFCENGADNNPHLEEGYKIEENTGVTLYAETSVGTYGGEIPIYYATNFNASGPATVEMSGVEVGENGELKIGMSKTSRSTNWHLIQLKGVTAQVNAVELYANLKAEAEALITDDMSALITSILTDAMVDDTDFTTAEEYQTAIKNLEDAIVAFKEAVKQLILDNLDLPQGRYYMVNAYEGTAMAAGSSYGTKGILNAQGIDLNLTYDIDSESYFIETNIYNNETDHFLGSNLFMDAPAFGWTIEPDESGWLCTISAEIEGAKKYIVASDGSLALADELSDQAYWMPVIADNWEAVNLEEGLETLKEASPYNGVDATFLLKDAQFNRNDHRWVAWTVEGEVTTLGGGCSSTNGNGCAEAYKKAFTISQTAVNAPKGTYELTAQGFYRQESGEEAAPEFFINDVKAEVPAISGSENNMDQAGISFTEGLYTIEPIMVYVAEDGDLTVGITNNGNTNQWVIWDNFRLTYYGEDDIPTGITELSNTTSNKKTIYNLAGQRVVNAQKGLFIVNGKKVVK